ncbi:hypothetical protein B5X24_HaOG202730 [Helicoverpa armigera]|uniref:Uncharacterized protein n=1 Tax=Helicoverpa armigera TaxID=29058 RepID=A0A2W1BSE6_HELAM|nr:hypothetical protein B5X24_HaOG202730 [Helicoverpa armigera]
MIYTTVSTVRASFADVVSDRRLLHPCSNTSCCATTTHSNLNHNNKQTHSFTSRFPVASPASRRSYCPHRDKV